MTSSEWRRYLAEARANETLPQVPQAWIGMGPSFIALLLARVGFSLAERHVFDDKGTHATIYRTITAIEGQPEIAAGGGAAYYKQHGALNSGFADLIDLSKVLGLLKNKFGVDYTAFHDLVVSLEDITNKHLAGKLDDLADQYEGINQFGLNLLGAAIKDGRIDGSRAPLLRTTVHEIFYDMFQKLKTFIEEEVPEIKLDCRFNTFVTDTRLEAYGSTNQMMLTLETAGTDKPDHLVVSLLVLLTGTRTISLIEDEIKNRMVNGSANADVFQKHLKQQGLMDAKGDLKDGINLLGIGQVLHGIDGFGVMSTLVGANDVDRSKTEPCSANKDYAKSTGSSYTMMARTQGNFPPPRLAHTIKCNDDVAAPYLTNVDVQALALLKIDSYPIYTQIIKAWMARHLGCKPDAFKDDKTTDAQIKRFLNDIRANDEGQRTRTYMQRQADLGREFGAAPSKDPTAAEEEAKKAFPTTRRSKEDFYNSRLTYVTSAEYVKNHSNAETMKGENDVYANFAAPPASNVRVMCEQHEAGYLKFATGNSRDIQPHGEKAIIFDGKVYHGGHAPGIITNELDPIMKAIEHRLLKDENGVIEYGFCRQLLLADGTPLPIFDYGNNSSGRTVIDIKEKRSTIGKKTRDVATLFANFTNKPTLACYISTVERCIVLSHREDVGEIPSPVDLVWKNMPSKFDFFTESMAAVPFALNLLEVELYLRLIIDGTTGEEWNEAYDAVGTRESREAFMKGWLKTKNETLTNIANSYLLNCKNIQTPERKSYEQFWKESPEPPAVAVHAAWEEVLKLGKK